MGSEDIAVRISAFVADTFRGLELDLPLLQLV